MRIDILRPKGTYRSRRPAPLRSVCGEVLGEVGVCPPLLVDLIGRELRSAPRQPREQVLEAIAGAAERFATGVVAGQTADDYVAALNRVAGLPIAVIEAARAELCEAMRAMRSILDAQSPRGIGGATVWIPRGSLLGVVAPSNHPATHVAWLQGLGLGYKVLVRPGGRDPLTPHRLVHALLEAGLDPTMIAFVPGDHAAALQVVASADIGLVFGADLRAYEPARAPIVARGPGYSKVIAGDDAALDASSVAACVAESVLGDAGVKCSNASMFISERQDFGAIRESVVERLAAAVALPLGDRRAVLPIFSCEEARRWQRALGAAAQRLSLVALGSSSEPTLVEFGDGSAALLPTAFECAHPGELALQFEWPFPALWLARVPRLANLDGFGSTLVMGYLGADAALLQRLIDDPLVKRVVHGAVPTHRTHPALPHDDFLASRLMTAKASLGVEAPPRAGGQHERRV